MIVTEAMEDVRGSTTLKSWRHANLLTEIQYMYSNAPTGHIQKLGDLLANAVRSSRQWKIERSLGETTTNCLTIMVPQNPTQDISITLWVGPETGLHLNSLFNLVPQWTSLPSHGEP